MKPITLRRTVAASPSFSLSCRSSPGAENPVQDATTTCVIRARSSAPRSNRSIACIARASAQGSYCRIRAAVEGNAPRL